ncbi:LysR family transcriptional regulator [Alteromonas sp. KUL49]|uniref:LysR family transcriptional regulator n=1 Tax=Alteromonas sp. KUL49 TaxID=2480798 RepID=UPI00102EFFB6|nr:LysR family transcriptional regulator [Alteromonas sp. KUL49]TAP40138.1 LysR family transcriptional regulator [Alteromonas sp. KUL49]GEA11253.1 transcriptional regulator [Alteromonas sp. KUL49]
MKSHKKVERLMLFSAVAETLNYGTAAEKLGISRGYLSEQIKALELALGVKLLQRSTRQVNLTSEGKQVHADAQLINNAMVAMEKKLNKEQTELKGEISVTAPNMFAHYILSDICYDFTRTHPAVTFSIDSSYQRHDLNRGHFDLAFRSTNTPPQDMVAKPLMSYQHVIVAAPSYVDEYGLPKDGNALLKHQCLHGPDIDTWTINRKRFPIKGSVKLNDNVNLINRALDGRGIARLPDYIVSAHLRNGSLVQVLEEHTPTPHKLYIIHPQKLHQSLRVREFIDAVTSIVSTTTNQ